VVVLKCPDDRAPVLSVVLRNREAPRAAQRATRPRARPRGSGGRRRTRARGRRGTPGRPRRRPARARIRCNACTHLSVWHSGGAPVSPVRWPARQYASRSRAHARARGARFTRTLHGKFLERLYSGNALYRMYKRRIGQNACERAWWLHQLLKTSLQAGQPVRGFLFRPCPYGALPVQPRSSGALSAMFLQALQAGRRTLPARCRTALYGEIIQAAEAANVSREVTIACAHMRSGATHDRYADRDRRLAER